MKGWTIPRCFEGRTVAVLASGPSMSQRVADAVHLAGVPAIAVNSTFRLAPWAWALYAADGAWWGHEANRDAHRFEGLRISCEQVKGVHMLHNAGPEGYTDDPGEINTHGNSGSQAMQIAIKTGAAKVLLCGFDMHQREASHWHGDHPSPLRSTLAETYTVFIKRMERAAPLIARCGVDVVNCTPGSALRGFRASTLQDEIGAQAHNILV